MSVFWKLKLKPTPPVSAERAAMLARIAAADSYAELSPILNSLPGLSAADWAACQSAVKRRMAELAAM